VAKISDQTELSYELRLRKIERELTWTRFALISLAVICGISFTVARSRNYAKVNADEFVLKDSSGRIRARLAISADGPALELYSSSGEERAALVGGSDDANLDLYLPVTGPATSRVGVNLFKGKIMVASLDGGPASTDLRLKSAMGTGVASVEVKRKTVMMGLDGNPAAGSGLALEARPDVSCLAAQGDEKESQGAGASMCLDSRGRPMVALSGRRGHETILGVAPLQYQRTGESWGSSAASLVLMAKDGKVLWAEPR
jgi:hypothetical protein